MSFKDISNRRKNTKGDVCDILNVLTIRSCVCKEARLRSQGQKQYISIGLGMIKEGFEKWDHQS